MLIILYHVRSHFQLSSRYLPDESPFLFGVWSEWWAIPLYLTDGFFLLPYLFQMGNIPSFLLDSTIKPVPNPPPLFFCSILSMVVASLLNLIQLFTFSVTLIVEFDSYPIHCFVFPFTQTNGSWAAPRSRPLSMRRLRISTSNRRQYSFRYRSNPTDSPPPTPPFPWIIFVLVLEVIWVFLSRLR